jgi:peroxiredoxin
MFQSGPMSRSTRRMGGCALASVLAVAALVLAGSAAALGLGDEAASFEAAALDGERSLSLGQHRGKVVYLDFWASWCDPCTVAIPMIETLRAEFSADDFQVLAINLDQNPEKAKKFLRKHPVGYPSVSDPTGRLPRMFGLETMPTSYLIDRRGVIRYVHRGFRRGDLKELRARISKLVAKR